MKFAMLLKNNSRYKAARSGFDIGRGRITVGFADVGGEGVLGLLKAGNHH